MLPPHELWCLARRHVGRRTLVFERLESTNTLALGLAADSAHDGVVLLTREQSAGRGQYGRSWQAPPGSSVLLSALLLPPPHVCRPALLTAWAAVAVCETIAELTGAVPAIKWPNDVYLGGKKVCGILIEQRSTGLDGAAAVAVGIGLNVRQPAGFFIDAGLPLGGSLHTQTGAMPDIDDTARRLIARLDDGYGPLLEGEPGDLQEAWRRHFDLIGKRVRLETVQNQHVGVVRDLTLDAVVVDAGGAGPLCLVPESVRHITAV
jgi:BirA family transcriptional regulator, biotin operon repressor / biotin---[acetyl-CoA-carboxylase] ligase